MKSQAADPKLLLEKQVSRINKFHILNKKTLCCGDIFKRKHYGIVIFGENIVGLINPLFNLSNL